MNLKEIGWKRWYGIHLAQDRDTRRALVNEYELIYDDIYLLQMGFHPVAAVGKLVRK